MSPSSLYNKLYSLVEAHCNAGSLSSLLSIRSPDAQHGWGHAYLVSQNPTVLPFLSNERFEAHVMSSGVVLDASHVSVHDIVVDEHQRKASARMSYFLKPHGSEEVVEHDLIWTFKFTDEDDVDRVLIKESLEFIDAAAGARLGKMIREIQGEVKEGMTGSVAIKLQL